MASPITNSSTNLMRKLHYASGITLSLFIAIHLFNHLTALWGPDMHIQWMDKLRMLYRNVLMEGILLLCVLLQVGTGLRLALTKQAASMAEKVQIYSGFYLSFFLIVHVSAVLFGRYTGLDTNFYFASTGMNYSPFLFFFIPYYFFAVASISLHVSALHYIKTGSRPQAYAMALIGIIASVLILLAFTNYFKGQASPQQYQNFLMQPLGLK